MFERGQDTLLSAPVAFNAFDAFGVPLIAFGVFELTDARGEAAGAHPPKDDSGVIVLGAR